MTREEFIERIAEYNGLYDEYSDEEYTNAKLSVAQKYLEKHGYYVVEQKEKKIYVAGYKSTDTRPTFYINLNDMDKFQTFIGTLENNNIIDLTK